MPPLPTKKQWLTRHVKNITLDSSKGKADHPNRAFPLPRRHPVDLRVLTETESSPASELSY